MNDMTSPVAIPDSIAILKPSTEVAECSGLLSQAQAFNVVDDDTAQIATDELRSIVQKKNTVEAERLKITKPLHEAKKNLDALFKRMTDPLEAAERVFKSKLIAYQDSVERKRREEAAKADEAARKERERLEAEAKKLEKKGHVEAAEAKREVAAMLPTTITAAPASKPDGLSTRANWKGRLRQGATKRDLIAFIAGVPVEQLKNASFDYLLDINDQKVNGLAKQCEAVDLGVPCLEGFNDKVAAIR